MKDIMKIGDEIVTRNDQQETLVRVFQKTDHIIPGGKSVFIIDVLDNIPEIALTNIQLGKPANQSIGLTSENIDNGDQQGYVTMSGLVHSLDTSMWNEADDLWADPDIPGNLTSIEPANSEPVLVGIVFVSDAINGSIHVIRQRIQQFNGQ